MASKAASVTIQVPKSSVSGSTRLTAWSQGIRRDNSNSPTSSFSVQSGHATSKESSPTKTHRRNQSEPSLSLNASTEISQKRNNHGESEKKTGARSIFKEKTHSRSRTEDHIPTEKFSFSLREEDETPSTLTPTKRAQRYVEKSSKQGLTGLHVLALSSFAVAVIAITMSTSLFSNWSSSKKFPSFLPGDPSSDTKLEDLNAYLDEFLSKAEKWIEEELHSADDRLVGELQNLKLDLEAMIREQFRVVATQLGDMHGRVQGVEESLMKFGEMGLLSVTDAMDLFNAVMNEKGTVSNSKSAISFSDFHAAIQKMIEAEIEKHSADGIARVDYAVASGGGKVLDHSEGYYPGNKLAVSWRDIQKRIFSSNLHSLANDILKPKFGEPGRCLPLKGSDVFVTIGLRVPIFPQAVTLEHVSKRVAYDLTSAPKHFEVYGSTTTNENQQLSWILLGEFIYDITADSNVQTFNLTDGAAVDKIDKVKLHVLSNHGSHSYTCIYRVRVHGHV